MCGPGIISIIMQDSSSDLRRKKETFAQQIRKGNREAIFQKRRNMGISQQETQMGSDSKNLIVDSRFSEQVKQFNRLKFNRDQFVDLLKAVYDSDIVQQLYGLVGVRKLLSEKGNQPIQQVIDAGLVPKLIEFSKQTAYPQMQLEAVWCLSNVASGTQLQCSSILEKEGVKMFVDLTLSQHPGIVQQSIWTLGNIACDLPAHRDSIIRQGGLKNIIKVIEVSISELPKNPAMKDLVQSSAWALSALCRNYPLPKYTLVKDAIEVFFLLITRGYISDEKNLGYICWAISYYTDNKKQLPGSIDKIQQCIRSGVLPSIISFLNHQYDSLVVASLHIVGNISTGNDAQLDYLLSLGVLTQLQSTIKRSQKTIRKQTCWVLSNITAGNSNAVAAVFSQKSLLQAIISILMSDLPDIQVEALYVMINSTQYGDKPSLFNLFRTIGLIKYICEIIRNPADTSLLETTLECLDCMLEVGASVNGQGNSNPFVQDLFAEKVVNILEEMQCHSSDKVFQRVQKILQDNFELESSLQI